MKYVSSDTNVWFDFEAIHREDLPFRAPYVYIMYEEAISLEFMDPPDLENRLVNLGLQGVDITDEELYLADDYAKYPKLSRFDRIALAIARNRNITLLTGDLRLRKAALAERVPVLGTIGLLDELYKGRFVSAEEYRFCLIQLKDCVAKKTRRLPVAELDKRLMQITKETEN